MKTLVDKVGDVTIVAVQAEELDASNADAFRSALAPVLKDCRNLVIDLGQVQFLDSRGCGAILLSLKHLSKVGGDIKLCCVTEPVRMTFDLVRMDSICEVLPTREEAVQAFQKGQRP
jgi:anti-sigma B factor antagonist